MQVVLTLYRFGTFEVFKLLSHYIFERITLLKESHECIRLPRKDDSLPKGNIRPKTCHFLKTLTVDMSILSYCFYFSRRDCPCSGRLPTVPEFVSIINAAHFFKASNLLRELNSVEISSFGSA